MQGTLTVTSALGEGSCFVFSIPLRQTEDETISKAQPVPAQSSQTLPGERIHPQQEIEVLIVDDSETNRIVLAELLSQSRIFWYRWQRMVGRRLMTKNKSFDLVLMDLRMPGMGGYRATRMIHKLTCNPDIQIIAISAGVYPSFHDHMHRWGFVDFIRKPYRRDELLQVIHHHFQLNWQANGEESVR